MLNFLHGVEIQEIDAGTKVIKTAKSSVIGVIGTAPNATFPLNTPILITGSKVPEIMGSTGAYDACETLPNSISCIFDQIGAVLVVVLVKSEEELAAGLDAFLASESTIHVKPQVLIAPGFSGDEELLTAMIRKINGSDQLSSLRSAIGI
jgi:phage tail sheath protein FI